MLGQVRLTSAHQLTLAPCLLIWTEPLPVVLFSVEEQVYEVGREDDGGPGALSCRLYRHHIVPVQIPADNLPVLPVAGPGTGRNRGWGWGWVGEDSLVLRIQQLLLMMLKCPLPHFLEAQAQGSQMSSLGPLRDQGIMGTDGPEVHCPKCFWDKERGLRKGPWIRTSLGLEEATGKEAVP